MTRTTRKQREKIYHKWVLSPCGMTYREFRSKVQPTFGCDDAVTVPWAGMWLCIETDGYCHT